MDPEDLGRFTKIDATPMMRPRALINEVASTMVCVTPSLGRMVEPLVSTPPGVALGPVEAAISVWTAGTTMKFP